MLPRGYSMKVPFPPGSGDVELQLNEKTIRRFPYATTDTTIEAIARLHKRFGIFEQPK